MAMPGRRTKIVATVGPASDPPAVLQGLFEAGADVARVGLAHGPIEATLDRIARIRAAADAVGRPVGVMADLPGPKVRTAPFDEDGVVLPPGASVHLVEAGPGDHSTAAVIGVQLAGGLGALCPGDRIALGDGGVWASAQDLASPYGGLLRLDVDGATVPSVPADNPFVGVAGARPETWVYGLRNPWRFSFDAATGDLWIADVGEDAVEEVNVLPAGSPGGANYGWPIMEGDRCLPGTQCDPTGLTLPDFVYTHASGWGSSVTGGAVYRGSAIPELYGSYVFGDFVSGRLFVVPSGAGGTAPAPLLQTPYRIASFGEDEALEIHLVDFAGGVLYRLAPAGP